MVADAISVLDAAGFGRASVLGYSMGGRIALHIALNHPERVDQLVLIATSARTIPTWSRNVLFAISPYVPIGPKPRQRYRFPTPTRRLSELRRARATGRAPHANSSPARAHRPNLTTEARRGAGRRNPGVSLGVVRRRPHHPHPQATPDRRSGPRIPHLARMKVHGSPFASSTKCRVRRP